MFGQSREPYRVRIGKEILGFCAAHFISYEGQCEPLHGHNYRVAVEMEGSLTADAFVFDFIALTKHIRQITDELDHRVLLPLGNPVIALETDARRVHVRYQEREWVFPREDCVLLSLENTTAELLARHIALRLLEELHRHHGYTPALLRVEVEEMTGQSAIYQWRDPAGAPGSSHAT